MTEHPDLFAQISRIITDIAGGPDLLDVEVTPDTHFYDDLALESIDLVTLATTLHEETAGRINLAGRLAELTLDDIIALTVGRITELAASDLDPMAAR